MADMLDQWLARTGQIPEPAPATGPTGDEVLAELGALHAGTRARLAELEGEAMAHADALERVAAMLRGEPEKMSEVDLPAVEELRSLAVEAGVLRPVVAALDKLFSLGKTMP